MSKTLVWKPQKAFETYFYTSPADIKKNRTVFKNNITNFVSYGGRGSGKTYTFADAVIVEASLRKIRVLVTREIQDSIDDSIKAELEKAIVARGLEGFFKITKTYIEGANGSYFIFKGLKNNIRSIKSISNVDVALCEEAESITKVSWDTFLPSIRPDSGRPIVIVIFNPQSILDDTYQRWVLSPPPGTEKKLINHNDNEFFPEFLEEQRQHAKKTLPLKYYNNIWEGIPRGSEGDVIIDQEWIKAARFASRHEDWQKVGPKVVSYDPAGQGRDNHAVAYADGNCVTEIDEWPLSPDLRFATNRALSMARKHEADEFTYDECGGFGDGVSVFAKDNIEGISTDEDGNSFDVIDIKVTPFNAGDSIEKPEDWNDEKKIKGTEKTPYEIYCNQKAHAHGVIAQQLYNTYRFIELGERDIDFNDMLSLDIEDDILWRKIMREMSTALWVKSENNSKKKVESKDAMKKRTGQESPNINDAIVMLRAPREIEPVNFFEVDW